MDGVKTVVGGYVPVWTSDYNWDFEVAGEKAGLRLPEPVTGPYPLRHLLVVVACLGCAHAPVVRGQHTHIHQSERIERA